MHISVHTRVNWHNSGKITAQLWHTHDDSGAGEHHFFVAFKLSIQKPNGEAAMREPWRDFGRIVFPDGTFSIGHCVGGACASHQELAMNRFTCCMDDTAGSRFIL